MQLLFEPWLASQTHKTIRVKQAKELVAHFDLNKNLKNQIYPKQQGVMQRVSSSDEKPNFKDGYKGEGLNMDGDAWLDLSPVGAYDRADAFSISLWANIPSELEDGVIFHKGIGAALYCYKGYHLAIKDNKFELMLAANAPYNAVIEYSDQLIPRDNWIHLTLSYDGTSSSEGLKLFVNGQEASTTIDQDHLYKDITLDHIKKQVGLQIGARWRGKGIKSAMIDEIQVWDRELSLLEINSLYDEGIVSSIISTDAEDLSKEDIKLLKDHFLKTHPSVIDDNAEMRKLHADLNQETNDIQEMMVMAEMEKPRPAYILDRGQYDQPTEQVFPNTPEAILPFDPSLPKNRKGLAKWLFDEDHPLTARVIANRYWQLFFNRGLVKTTADFGNQGSTPDNSALLDWLASSLKEEGWDIKSYIKRIVMSATYRQNSVASEEALEKDPDNVLLSRGPSGRLPAEMIRDNILVASGLLDPTIGGRSVYPNHPEGLWKMFGGSKYPTTLEEDKYRRSFYTIWKRTVPHPTQSTFDAPERSECTVKRQETNTPLQALALMNDQVYLDAAKQMAIQMQKGLDIEKGFQKLTGRKPATNELDILKDMYTHEKQKFSNNPEKIEAWIAGDQAIVDKAATASFAIVMSTIMNADATIVKR